MIEVHPDPDHALSDGAQTLTPENFGKLMERVRAIALTIGKPLHPPLTRK
jgi:3-deoxy-7-phosphoheptulonate synthase